MASKSAPQHPGKILYDQVMVPLGVSRNKLARDIDVPVGRISDIVNGKRGVTPDTALRLARYFGTEPELWMRLQWEYDLFVARATTWPAVEPRVRIFDPSEAVMAEEDGHGPALDRLEAEAETDTEDELPGAGGGGSIVAVEPDDAREPPADIDTEEGMAALAAALEQELATSQRHSATGDDSVPASDPPNGAQSAEADVEHASPETTPARDDATGTDDETRRSHAMDGQARGAANSAPFAFTLSDDMSVGLPEDVLEGAEADEPPPEPLVLLDAVDETAADGEAEDAKAAGAAADEDLESLEIPDPDKLRYRMGGD